MNGGLSSRWGEEGERVEVEMTELTWPEFGRAEEGPERERGELEMRLGAARAAMRALGLSHLLVYGDREHSANLRYLCGFDPRFEEALLIVGGEGMERLLVGNEGLGYTGV